jgi:transposase
MNSVGIDLHRDRSHVAVIDAEGELSVSRRIVNSRETFLELLDGLEGESRIAVEATYGWEWLAELLEDAGYEIHLSHPLRTRAIAAARVKTDGVDAKTLAHSLRADLPPEAYVAPRELRDLRELPRHRIALTSMRSALKNRVHAILAKHGITRQHSDLFGPGGRRFLSELQLREAPRRRLDSVISPIDDFDREIGTTTAEIEQRAKTDDRVEVLTQIRGVGRHTAMLLIAEVGEIERFPAARHPCARAGLTPTVRSSDGNARPGRVSRQGSPASRWTLVEAAQKCTTGGGPPRESFERIAKRRGRKIAKVAVARQILTLSYDGLRDGEIRCLARRGRASPKKKPTVATRPPPRTPPPSVGLAPRRRRDADTQTSSPLVIASPAQNGRPPDRAPEHRTTLTVRPARPDRRLEHLPPNRLPLSEPAPDRASPLTPTLTKPAPSWMTNAAPYLYESRPSVDGRGVPVRAVCSVAAGEQCSFLSRVLFG